jgi:hypothetical protein
MHSRRIFEPLIRFVDIFSSNKNKKGHQPDFLSPLVAFGNPSEWPHAGPDTVTKIIMLLTRSWD